MRGTVAVTGGAGYVGAHVCLALARAGFLPVAIDDLSTGRVAAVRFGPLERCDVTGPGLPAVLDRLAPVAVVHAAARAEVAESFAEPALYRRINLGGTERVVAACAGAGVSRLVLISTAAVYGAAASSPIPESAPLRPISPYGASKLAAERALNGSGLSWTVLRLFNVAGAAAGEGIGEDHPVETHLLPLAIRAALGVAPPLRLHAGHATPDGSALRDYVHACDVADAVRRAVGRLMAGGGGEVLNIGSGVATSVREVVAAVGRAAGRPVPLREAPVRPGDPAVLVADPSRARLMLGFDARRSDLQRIVADALAWERRRSSREPAG